MKQKGLILGFVICVCLIGLTLYITKMTRNLFGEPDDEYEEEIDREEESKDKYVVYQVSPGLFVVSDTLTGEVVFDDDAVGKYTFDDAKESDIKVKVGQMVKKNETLGYSNGKSVVSKADGIVVDVKRGDACEIQLLDYAKSRIRVRVPQNRQTLFHAGVQVFGSYEKEENIPLELVKIEPRVDMDCFEVYFENKFSIYENTQVGISITYLEKEDTIFVPREFVKTETNGRQYVTVREDNDNTMKYYVIVGEENSRNYELLDAEELSGRRIVVDIKEAAIDGN